MADIAKKEKEEAEAAEAVERMVQEEDKRVATEQETRTEVEKLIRLAQNAVRDGGNPTPGLSQPQEPEPLWLSEEFLGK
jgi:hypothetical protein